MWVSNILCKNFYFINIHFTNRADNVERLLSCGSYGREGQQISGKKMHDPRFSHHTIQVDKHQIEIIVVLFYYIYKDKDVRVFSSLRIIV